MKTIASKALNKDVNQKLVTVGVYFHGNNLLPDEITNALKIEPTYSRTKGDKWKTCTGKEVVAKTGGWTLRARYRAATQSLADQARYITESLGDKIDNLKEVEGIERAFVSLFYSPEVGYGSTVEADFSADELKSLASLGFPVEITIDLGDRRGAPPNEQQIQFQRQADQNGQSERRERPLYLHP
ncbi:MAG: DUF4279 domain-containing protein [Betaproteobacteria bacterium]|nr:DUF4279 domain-containing protein [Betaproteobacteria bacterium]